MALKQLGFALILLSVRPSVVRSLVNIDHNHDQPCEANSTTYRRLKQQVLSFYSLSIDPALQLAGHRPCTFSEGATYARPKWLVTSLNARTQGTCPWKLVYNEDEMGGRFPCRLVTASLQTLDLQGVRRRVKTSCLKQPGRRWSRRRGRMCQPLRQSVPVLIRRQGRCRLQNMTIIAGFTCAFESHMFHRD